jgi:hypothetical protein
VRFIGAVVGGSVQQIPLRGQPIVHPQLLSVDERALSLAEQQVLEGRDWQ